MRENTDQKNSEYGHFSRSDKFGEKQNISTKFQDISWKKLSKEKFVWKK